MSETELSPCPFCGTAPRGPHPADEDWWIECEHCEIVMSHFSKTQLVKMWNSRINPVFRRVED